MSRNNAHCRKALRNWKQTAESHIEERKYCAPTIENSANESRVEVLVGNEYINHDYCEVAFFFSLDAGRRIGEGTKGGGGGGYTKRRGGQRSYCIYGWSSLWQAEINLPHSSGSQRRWHILTQFFSLDFPPLALPWRADAPANWHKFLSARRALYRDSLNPPSLPDKTWWALAADCLLSWRDK